ncbi:sulfatase-like hydrolase/transferase [Saccharomonospora sp. NPDC046836]|uniref:sulfatase family protein n=1 Tax=Saccharomonospora sp. NPDC046836 TaxID=3156921 RepID=UPI0033F211D5
MTAKPNVLLLIADQHRFDWIEGATPGLPVRTPNLRRLQERGVTFTHATTPSPLCAPARACLATARDYDSGFVQSNAFDLPLDAPTYFRALRDDAAYHVAGVGKFDLHKATLDWGLDGSRSLEDWGLSTGIDNEGKFDSLWSSREGPRGPYVKWLTDRGFAEPHLTDYDRRRHAPYADVDVSPLSEDDYLDNWIAANAMRMLDQRPAGKPWHLVVNFAGPHDPMDVTEDMLARWADVEFPLPVEGGEFNGDHQAIRRRYAAMIENIDRHVGDLLDALQNSGELENTLVIYTSDHGELLGDRGVWGKGVPLDPSIRIPLIIAGPGVSRHGQELDVLVTLEDVAATILDAAVAQPLPGMTAQSLLPVLTEEVSAHRDFVVSGLDRTDHEINLFRRHYGGGEWAELQSWRTVTRGRFKLTVSPQLPHPILVDLTADPHELRNIADQHPQLVTAMLEYLPASRSGL